MELNVSHSIEKHSDNIKEELGETIKELSSVEGSVMDLIKEMKPSQVAKVLETNYMNKKPEDLTWDHGHAAMVQTAISLISNEQFKDDPEYQPLVIDGIYGPKTKGAVGMFQLENKLNGEGRAGPNTIAALIRKLRELDGGATSTTEDKKTVEPPVAASKKYSILLSDIFATDLDTVAVLDRLHNNDKSKDKPAKKGDKKDEKLVDPLLLFDDKNLLDSFLKEFDAIKINDFIKAYGNDGVIRRFLDDTTLGRGTLIGKVKAKNGSFHAKYEDGHCMIKMDTNFIRTGERNVSLGAINLQDIVKEGATGYEIDKSKFFQKVAGLIQRMVAERDNEIVNSRNLGVVKETQRHPYTLEDLGIPMDYRAKAFMKPQMDDSLFVINSKLLQKNGTLQVKYDLGLTDDEFTKGFIVDLNKIVGVDGSFDEGKRKAIIKNNVKTILDTKYTKGKAKESETA